MQTLLIDENGGTPKIWGFTKNNRVFWGGLGKGGFVAEEKPLQYGIVKTQEKIRRGGYLSVPLIGECLPDASAARTVYEVLKKLLHNMPINEMPGMRGNPSVLAALGAWETIRPGDARIREARTIVLSSPLTTNNAGSPPPKTAPNVIAKVFEGEASPSPISW